MVKLILDEMSKSGQLKRDLVNAKNENRITKRGSKKDKDKYVSMIVCQTSKKFDPLFKDFIK